MHAEAGAHEDPRRPSVRRGTGVRQHLQPRDDVGHGWDLERAAEIRHLEGDVVVLEGAEDGVEVAPRAHQDRHLLPLVPFAVQTVDLRRDVRGLGLLVGLPMQWYVLEVIILDESGFLFPMHIPWKQGLLISGLAMLTATLAGLGPALYAVRQRIPDAIAYE